MNLLQKLTILLIFTLPTLPIQAEVPTKNILLLAGKKTHGFGHHECNSDISVLENLLQRQTQAKFNTTLFLNGAWPTKTQLEEADAIVIISDGDKKHIMKDKMTEFDSLLDKNHDLGLLFVHYATVPDGRKGTYFDKWIGGYYAGQANSQTLTKYSHIQAKLFDHPVNLGVEPYNIFDEIYYRMDYVKNIKPIVVAEPLSDIPEFHSPTEKLRFEKDNEQVKTFQTELERTIFWSFERETGGKSIGLTMGHIHKNFWMNESIRKQMINSVAWISGLKIPAEGFDPLHLTEEQLNLNHSQPRAKKKQ